MHTLKFASKYRPRVHALLASEGELTTTRMYDEKQLQEGDAVMLHLWPDTGLNRAATVVRITTETFASFLASVSKPHGTALMFADYYGRTPEPDDEVKHITMKLR